MTRRKKILYSAVHEVLEYDDVRLLMAAGFDVFSINTHDAFSAETYGNPACRGNRLRGPIPGAGQAEDLTAAKAGGVTKPNGVRRFSAEFIDRFDAVIINHETDLILGNIDVLSRRPLIRRTLGQTTTADEIRLRPVAPHLTVVRYSPRETHPDWLPADAVIAFGKFPGDYPRWRGGPRLVTFCNHLERAGASPSRGDYERIVAVHEAGLYGLGNEAIPFARGVAPPALQLDLIRDCRAYVYAHSLVASYTLNLIEAMFVGAPIVAPSARFVSENAPPDWWPARYAVEDILGDGAGHLYDTVEDARRLIAHVSAARGAPDEDARATETRHRARTLFDAHAVAAEWKALIERIT